MLEGQNVNSPDDEGFATEESDLLSTWEEALQELQRRVATAAILQAAQLKAKYKLGEQYLEEMAYMERKMGM